MALQFVGSTIGSVAGTGGITLNLAALSGGIASAAAVDDLVVVFHGWASTANGSPAVMSPAATLIADLYANNNNDANLGASCFFYDGSTSTVTVNSVNAAIAALQVWRGADRITPLDATPVTAVNGTTNAINPAAITPVTANAAVLVGALIATETAGTVSNPTGFTSANAGSRNGTGIGAGLRSAYKTGNAAGVAVNPSSLSCTTGGNGSSGAAFTIALRPSLGRAKHWNGAAWRASPVKVWNGSAWVLKPMKRWSGSAWILTDY